MSETKEWEVVDHELRAIAKQRSGLDLAEARLLVRAERLRIWRELGFISLDEYMERVLGYAPKAARDRLRVAKALEELPLLSAALGNGDLNYTGIRELARVATPTTECAWRDWARGKSVRDIEEKIAKHARGDLPTDPGDADLRPRILRFEVKPVTFALFREAQRALEEERAMRLDDDALLALLAGCATGDVREAPKFQIAITRCEACGQGWQHGGGENIAIDPESMDRAECDALNIGKLVDDLARSHVPARASADVPPRIRRAVWQRDGGRCAVPGCRARRHLEIHHIRFREHGGGHELPNLILLCDGHHVALHDGKLTISGEAPNRLLFHWTHPLNEHLNQTPAHVGRAERAPRDHAPGAKLAFVTMTTDVRKGLVKLGFSKDEAAKAIEAALTHVGRDTTAEALLLEAIKHCPKPRERA